MLWHKMNMTKRKRSVTQGAKKNLEAPYFKFNLIWSQNTSFSSYWFKSDTELFLVQNINAWIDKSQISCFISIENEGSKELDHLKQTIHIYICNACEPAEGYN